MTTSSPEIMIIGSSGMLGSTVHDYFRSAGYNIKTSKNRWPSEELKSEIRAHEGIIINCAGAIPQAKPSSYEINYELPLFIESVGKLLIQPCTDCVYSGNLDFGSFYKKTDPMDAKGLYPASKIKFQKNTQSANTKIIRTSIIGIDKNSYSLMSWFFKTANEKLACNGYTNHIWNGVTTLQWAKIAEEVIRSWDNCTKVVQVGSNPVSKFDLLSTINEIFDAKCQINEFKDKKKINKSLLSDWRLPDLATQISELKDYLREKESQRE